MYAANEQIIFVSKMRVEGRSAYIRAIENFLHDNRVIGLLSDQGNESLSQEVRCFFDPPIVGAF